MVKQIRVLGFRMGKRLRALCSILAVVVSWHFNESVGWAIFHWIAGPYYLIYKVFVELGRALISCLI